MNHSFKLSTTPAVPRIIVRSQFNINWLAELSINATNLILFLSQSFLPKLAEGISGLEWGDLSLTPWTGLPSQFLLHCLY